ncbi:MAG: AsmA family protein [Panacagrimonas sp.]|nr:AsmA family protein [Panacagrimonas sp.]MCC2658071.1 AsmA family protein [Panacagrimonas sp.]
MPRITTRRGIALAIGVALVALVLLWDWNWFKRPIEKRVEQQTGRRFVIGGDLDVDLGWTPRVTLDDVHLGNAPWARTQDMLGAERADITIDLRELIAGRLRLPSIALTAPRIDLQNSPEGGNWRIATPRPDEKEKGQDKAAPEIGRVRIDRGKITYFDPAERTDIEVDISTREGRQIERSLVLAATGTLRGLDFEADAKSGPVLSLADTQTPYPFDARVRAGKTRAKFEGTVTGLQAFTAARVQLDVQGDTLAALHPLTGLVLPETPPYRVAGLLIHEGPKWTFQAFDGHVGDSDLSGTLTATYANDRPNLVAKLKSKQLDLDDLAGMVGATPETGPGETASPQQEVKAAREQADPHLLPDKPVNLPQLRSMDADVEFHALSIKHEKMPLDNLRTHLTLDHGLLKLEPIDFGVAGGRIESNLVLDAREPAIGLDLRTNFSRVDLGRLLPANQLVDKSTGLIGGRAVMKSRGKSTAELLGNADGELGVAMRGGQFSNLLLEGAGLDAAEAIGFMVRGDRTVRVRCAVLDLEAKDGVFKPRAFVVDTTDTNIHVEGQIDMGKESLDLTVYPLPKDFSPLTLRSPLHVRGTLKNPQIRPDRSLLIKGGIAAVLGALVNPIAALLPLIETGPGKNADCDALVSAAERSARAPAAAVGKP